MPGVGTLPGFPYPTVLFDRLDEFLLEFEEQDELVQSGVVSEGEAAAYALVWEWGNMRQTQKGPKTTMGINPDGQRVWLSIQAPFGYIRIHQGEFWKIILEQMEKARFDSPDTGVISDELRKVAFHSAKKIAKLIRDSAPVDSGELRGSIKAVEPDDYATLDMVDEGRGTLVLDGVGGLP